MRSISRDRGRLLEFSVEGMHCASCGILIDEMVEQIEGVLASRTKVRKGRTLVETDVAGAQAGVIVAAISELGYRCVPISD